MATAPYLILRAFCKTESLEFSQSVAERLCEQLTQLGKVNIRCVQPYWKISGTHEINIQVDVLTDKDQTISEFNRLFDVDWTTYGELMIWQAVNGQDFKTLPLFWVSNSYVEP